MHGRERARGEDVVAAIRAAGGDAELVARRLAEEVAPRRSPRRSWRAVPSTSSSTTPASTHIVPGPTRRPKTGSPRTGSTCSPAVELIQRLVPAMRERGWGRVIQIGGGLAQQPSTRTRTTARRSRPVTTSPSRSPASCREPGVTSNVVAPGAIRVPMLEEILARWRRTSTGANMGGDRERGGPRHRPERRREVRDPRGGGFCGRVPRSPLAGYVSGVVLRVDGGMVDRLLTPMRTWDQGNTPRSAIR